MRSLTAIVSLLSLLPPLVAQDGIQWQKNWHLARADAARTGKLLLICFGRDDAAADIAAANRHRRLREACTDVIALFASPTMHGDDGYCPHTDCLTCAEHRHVDRFAARDLFGPGTVEGSQQLLLFPDGRIAWHGTGPLRPGPLADAIGKAETVLAKGDSSHRVRHEQTMLEPLLKKFRKDATAWLQVRTLLAHAKPREFPMLFAKLGQDDAAERMLRELAGLEPARAQPLLTSLNGQVAARLRQPLSAAIAELQQRRDGGLGTEHTIVVRKPLPVLGQPDELDGVRFVDDVARRLADLRGQITVLWFHLPDSPKLAADSALLAAFAAECRDLPVQHLALGASIDPAASLTLTRLHAFGFPAGTYRYDVADPLTGVREFPTVVVLDPAGQIVYRGTSRTEYQALVRDMLVGPAYAKALR